MKKRIAIFAFLSLASGAFSQAPDGINYQSVIRDNAGAVLTNSPVGMKIAIRQTTANGIVVYEESFAPTTSAYGLVNIVVGQGTGISGDFTTIDWSSGPYFVEVAADETGGTNYALLGTQQLMSVAYALHANNAENVTNDQVNDADADPTNELQDISLSGTDLSITNGSTVDLSVLQDGTGTDDQNISGSGLAGTDLTIGIEGGNNETVNLSSLVNDADADPTNELQDISLSGTDLSITNGSTVDLSAVQDGTGSDDQTLNLTGTNLSIESGNTVDLSALQDGTGTDDQNISGSGLAGTNLTIGIEGGGSQTIDLSTLVDDADADPTNEYNIGAILTGTTLDIIDAGGVESVDLSSLQDGTGTDNQTLSYDEPSATLTISNGNSVTVPNGDVTEITAGDGLSGGGVSGAITLDANANNGLNVDAGADAIQLGGGLTENTTIYHGPYTLNHDLNGLGDFTIMDAGVPHFSVQDNGITTFGGHTYWRTGGTGGIATGLFQEDGDDGRFLIYENGIASIDLDANSQFIFNEQGLDRDFRIEATGNENAFLVDAANNRVGIGTATPVGALDVSSTTSGVVMPRMTQVQRDAIATAVDGMMVYNTDENCMNVYQAGAWESLCGGAGSGGGSGSNQDTLIYTTDGF